VHLVLEGAMGRVLDGLHAYGQGCGDVFGLVVDEEYVFGGSVEAFDGVEVDGGLRFGEVECVGPGVVIEGVEPVEFCEDAGCHGVGHVGEDAGRNVGALETLCPFEHWGVDLGPEVGVGCDEAGELGGGEDDPCSSGGFVPVGFGGEVAAVVAMAVSPVLAVEYVFGEIGKGANSSPGCWIGRRGEDHTVVEEDCFYRSHKLRVHCKESDERCERGAGEAASVRLREVKAECVGLAVATIILP
jgi:hypothetical protein